MVTKRSPAKTKNRWSGVALDGDDTREIKLRTLIRAAGKAFGTKGFHNTTLDDVAAAVHVTKPALYRYVKNKHQLLYECHRISIGMAERAFEESDAAGGRPVEILHRFVLAYVVELTSELGTCVMLTEYYSMLPADNRRIQQRRRALDTALRSLVQRCVADGDAAPCDPKLAVFYFMGAINNISRWFTETGASSGFEVALRFADFTVATVCGRAAAKAVAGRKRVAVFGKAHA
ncbi:MAG: TetR/AcrR family transcriptional regulator [Burkholderiaceae bacterium]